MNIVDDEDDEIMQFEITIVLKYIMQIETNKIILLTSQLPATRPSSSSVMIIK